MALFEHRRKTLSKGSIHTPTSERRETAFQTPLNPTHHKNEISIVSQTEIGNASLSGSNPSLHRDFLTASTSKGNRQLSFGADPIHPLSDDDDDDDVLDIVYTPIDIDRKEKTLKYYSLDEALKSLQFGRFDYILILIISIIYFSIAIQSNISKMLYGLISHNEIGFNIPLNAEPLLYIAFGIGGAIGIYLCVLSDKFGRKRMIHYSSILLVLFSVLQIFSYNFHILIISRLLIGCCCCVSMISSLVLLIEYVPNPNRFRVIYFIFFIGTISYAVGSLIAYSVIMTALSTSGSIQYKYWRLLMLILSIPLWLIPILTYLYLPKSPHYLASKGDKEKVMQILNNIQCYNKDSFFDILRETQRLNIDELKNEREREWMNKPIIALFLLKQHRLTSILLCIISFSVCFIQSTIYFTQLLFVEYLLNGHHHELSSNQVLQYMKETRNFGIEGVVITTDIVMSVIVLLFMHFIDRKQLLIIGFAITTALLFIVMVLIIFDDYVIVNEYPFIHFISIILTFGANMSNDCCSFVLQIYILEYYCTMMRTTSLGFIFYGAGTVALILSFVIKIYIYSEWVIVMCYWLLGIIAFISSYKLETETRNKPLEDHVELQSKLSDDLDYVELT